MFPDRAALEAWLAEQPEGAKGCWLGIAKKDAGVASVSKAEAIDAGLCHGWIDGQLDRYDERHFLIRFTPRRPGSRWSQVNCARAEVLAGEGRVMPRGAGEIAAAKADGRWDAAYQPASRAEVPADLQAALDANPAAAAFFATLTGANRYAVLYRIGAVRRADTRARKIASFVAMLERGETVHG